MSYKYDISRGFQRAKSKTKRIIIGGVASALMLGGASIPALAAGNPPGYDNNPGRLQATEVGAQCGSGAGSGAFGAFGEQGAYGHDFRGGADGQATGDANSALCGQGHDNL